MHVVYGTIGMITIANKLRTTTERGTCVNYGTASGPVEAVSPLALAGAGSVFFTRPHLADYISNREEKFMRSGDLFVLFRKGKLKVNTNKILPLIRITEAHQIMEAGLTKGKLLLKNS